MTHLSRSLRAPLALVAVLVAALVVAPVALERPDAAAASSSSSSSSKDPRLTQRLYVPAWPAQRVDRDPRYRRIWSRPQAVWLTDGYPGLGQVRQVVARTVREARGQRRTPVFVVYAITNRDCGSYSAGGLGPRDYRAFVREVAQGLRGSRAMVVLEPDALANLGACDTSATTSLMKYATSRLARAGAWVYLDAGHSTWMPAGTMAARLKAAGARQARGFSTNVSNFNRTASERRFGDAVVRELARRGVKGARYVVDTSRNGGRHRVSDGWCNPSTARLGRSPRIVNRANARGTVDAYLWIKSPGESDGACRPGQPAAGQWWPAGARRLLR